MNEQYDVSHLSNDELLRSTAHCVSASRLELAKLLAHIGEVEARQLHLERGFSSLFQFCLEVHRYSEAATYRRVHAARLARQYPVLLERVASGALNLAAIKLIGPYLNEDNIDELIALADSTTRELERRLAARFEKPLIPDTIRKLPTRTAALTATAAVTQQAAEPLPAQGLGPATVPSTTVPPAAVPPKKEVIAPLTATAYKVSFTAPQSLRDKLDEARDLLGYNDDGLAAVLERGLDLLLAKLKNKKYGVTPRARASTGRATRSGATHSRIIPRSVRREVYKRDQGRCCFESADGKRCGARRALEFHHIVAFGRGGAPTADNISLRCKPHNLYEAELEYGAQLIRKHRAGD